MLTQNKTSIVRMYVDHPRGLFLPLDGEADFVTFAPPIFPPATIVYRSEEKGSKESLREGTISNFELGCFN